MRAKRSGTCLGALAARVCIGFGDFGGERARLIARSLRFLDGFDFARIHTCGGALKTRFGLLKLRVDQGRFTHGRTAATGGQQERDEQRRCRLASPRVCCSSSALNCRGPHHYAMPLVQHARHEIHFKLVYYGPGLGGKTTNLEFIHAHSKPERRGKLISLAAESERTLFFDLLPIELGEFRGYQVRLHLCTVPGQIAQEHTRRLVLRNVDGIVFVADSQEARLEDNLQSIVDLYANLRLQGDDPDKLPLVVQYNKRDLPDVLPVETLRQVLRVPKGVQDFEAVATQGQGVFDTMKSLLRQCLHLVGDPAHAREGRSPSILPGQRASMFPSSAGRISSPALRAPRPPSFEQSTPSYEVEVSVGDDDE